ncbi:MAG: LysR family transcriptional regulator [Pedosphaera sp.]|nr:LysR family transcriptional regulator [Pedosphaera sp.]
MNEPLDSRQLKAFVALAKTGSYTETAKQLYVTHSAISHSMRALESNAGCRLLSRVGKKVILTDAGEALLHHADQILQEMRQARLTLNGLNKWGFRRLRLAAEAALFPHFLTEALVGFHQDFPKVLMSAELLGGNDALTLLETNRVDMVLTGHPPADDRFEFVPLFGDKFHLVVNATHPWVAKGIVPRDELSKQPCIFYRAANQTGRVLEEYFAKDKVVLNVVGEIDNLTTVKEFVKQGIAMTMLPTWAVWRELKEGSLVALSLGRKSLQQTWGCVHWRSHPLNHAESTLMKLCRKGLPVID